MVNPMKRKITHLNYNWEFRPDFNENYLDLANWHDFAAIMLPHTNKVLPFNGFSEDEYQMISSYRRKVWIDHLDQGKKLVLEFEGVMHSCEIYINGISAGQHRGGYTPFQIDISPFVNYGSENDLFVKVDSREVDDVPPFGGVIDYLTYGGIYREVRLLHLDPLFLERVLITPLTTTGRVELRFWLSKVEPASKIDFTIKDSEGNVAFAKSFLFTGIQTGKVLIDVPNPKLWNLKTPHLYTLETTLWNSKNMEVDGLIERFGIRIVRFNEQGFFLNDEYIKLRGLNRHQSYPYVGYAMPLSMQYLDAKILKQELCVNIVRTSHYPQSRHFLSACDELGLLVFTEIPGWQHIGGDTWQRVLLKNTEEMVLTQYNHPSVVIWGVRVNESEDNHNLFTETNAIVRRYDAMRPTSGVRNFAFSELLEDVYAYNDFKHNGHNSGIEKKNRIVKKGTPYLITEHNGHMFPVKRYDNIEIRIAQALRHATVINATNQAIEVGGCIGWCMTDYNTHREFGSGDHVCYHGVMDMFRLPKLAAAVYASQQTQRPYLELSSTLVIGDSPQMARPPIFAFTNCDAVSLFRNDRFIARFTRDGKHFPHMFQPPIVIDDFVGDQIQCQENFQPNDATRLKKVLSRIASHGQQGLRIRDKIRAAWIMFRYHLSYKDAELLFLKYFSNLKKETGEAYFKFVGYREEKAVIERKYGLSHLSSITLETERNDLWEENTYDVLRIVISALDEYNETMVYCNDVVEIQSTGPIEIIGPRTLSLLGGSVAFYVRSMGIKGEGEIVVSHDRLGQKSLKIQVQRSGDAS